MKIYKYNQGGSIADLYGAIVRDIYDLGEEKSSSKSKTRDRQDSLLDKAIIDLIKESGIPADAEVFLNNVENFLADSSSVYDIASGVDNLGGTFSKLIAIQKMANVVRANKDAYNKTVSRLDSNGTGSDVALNSAGHVYVLKDNKLDTVTLDTLKENPSEYTPLTNNQLLSLRAMNTSLAGRTDILNDLRNAVGMEAVMKTINDAIDQFGSAKSKGAVLKGSSEVQKGLEGLYAIGSEIPNVMTSKESMLSAIHYLKNYALNKNAKNTLEATAILSGTTAEELLYSIILRNTDVMHGEQPKKMSGAGSSAGGTGEDGKNTKQVSYIDQVVNGRTVTPSSITLGSSEHGHGFTVSGHKYPVRTEKFENIGKSNMKDFLLKTSVGNAVDKQSISIGNTMVPDYNLNRLVYDGVSTLDRVYLPIDKREYGMTGRIKPDFEALNKYEKFKVWKRNHQNATDQEELLKIRELGLNGLSKKEGVWQFDDVQLFLTTKAYVSDEAINIDSGDVQWLDKTSKEEGKRLIDGYLNLVNYGSESAKKKKEATDDLDPGFWFTSIRDWNTLYKGTVFMPVSTPGTEVIAADNELAHKSYYMDVANQLQTQELEQSIKTNF